MSAGRVMLTPRQAAKSAGYYPLPYRRRVLSAREVRGLILAGRLHGERIGSTWMVHVDDLAAYLRSVQVLPDEGEDLAHHLAATLGDAGEGSAAVGGAR